MQRGSLKVIVVKGIRIWRAQWRDAGKGRTRLLGRVADVSRSEARAQLDAILGPLNIHSLRSPSSMTVVRFIETEYLPSASLRWKPSTEATTEQQIRDHIVAPIGRELLVSIRRPHMQALLNSMAGRGLSASLVSCVRWQLRAIFRMAAADGLIMSSPAEGLVKPRITRVVNKTTIAREDLMRIEFSLDLRERLFVRLMSHHGLRPGEVSGLQLGDVGEESIQINRRIYRGRVDTPKTKRSTRPVPLTTATKAILTAYLDMLTDRSSNAWMFPSENPARAISFGNLFRRRIRPRLTEIGLGFVNAQVFRRSWVSELGMVETDPKLRAAMAGHSVSVSENEYRMPRTEELQRAADALGKRLQ